MTLARTAVLAVAPVYRGLGYVVLDHDQKLLDWGYSETRTDKAATCLARVRAILVRANPDALVLEDIDAPACRRRPRLRSLISDLAALADSLGVAVACYAREAITACLSLARRASKDAIAAAVANKLPAIAHRLPAPRRIWESEKSAMSLFTAAGFALVHVKQVGGQ